MKKTSLERIMEKEIGKLATAPGLEDPAEPGSALVPKGARVERTKKEMEDFFIHDEELETSLASAVDLLQRIGIALFDESSVDLMKQCDEKLEARGYGDDDPLSLREYFGIKRETLSNIYEVATLLYQGGHYRPARDLLLLLINLDPTYPNTLMSLGLTLQAMKKFDNALSVYAVLTNMEPHVEAYIQSIVCCGELHHDFEAKQLLDQLEHIECNEDQKKRVHELKKKMKHE